MHKHPDDMDGLDDYDRQLINDTDYSRPYYATKAESGGDQQLIEDVSRASASQLLGQLTEIAQLSFRERFERLAEWVRTALLAYADRLAGWREEGKPSNST